MREEAWTMKRQSGQKDKLLHSQLCFSKCSKSGDVELWPSDNKHVTMSCSQRDPQGEAAPVWSSLIRGFATLDRLMSYCFYSEHSLSWLDICIDAETSVLWLCLLMMQAKICLMQVRLKISSIDFIKCAIKYFLFNKTFFLHMFLCIASHVSACFLPLTRGTATHPSWGPGSLHFE